MNISKLVTLIVVSVLGAILIASALNNPAGTRVSDSAFADIAPTSSPRTNAPVVIPTAKRDYLPIIFLNAPTDGFWSLYGNAGTTYGTHFLGTTDNVTLTLRVSNTIAYRIAPAADPTYGFAPNIIGGSGANTIGAGLFGATIAGGGVIGFANIITGTGNYAFIGGGASNTASAYNATVLGGYLNTASGYAAIVSGGNNNSASGNSATVGGGYNNTASRDEATVSGGWSNTASNYYATIGGGYNNTASGYIATVGGGLGNTASNQYATVGGGYQNTASNQYATVGGGYQNTASGAYATIPGGDSNVAVTYTLAAGRRAKANHQGAFVWGDSTNADFSSTANDQFLIRANGGVGINTNSPAANTLTVSGNGLRVATDGTTFARIQAGTATLGGGSGGVVNVFTVTFPIAFTTVPKVLATARGGLYLGNPVDDTFAVTTRRISTTQFVVNIYRVDANASWASNLQLDWFAWE